MKHVKLLILTSMMMFFCAPLHAVASSVNMAPIISYLLSDTSPVTDPVFTSSSVASVNENQTSAITLVATDSSTVTYSISGTDADSFAVNASTGVVTFNTAPDFEIKDSYTFTATATDTSGNASDQVVIITILDVVDEGIIHNGTIYDTVISPYTSKVWLDRNLGASQVCTSFDDTACYGDYYQWGRNYDGHQDPGSDVEPVFGHMTDLDTIGYNFITAGGGALYDWGRYADANGSLRYDNWSKTDESSVCPLDFRVPTISELKAELYDPGSAEIGGVIPDADKRVNAFESFLKLPTPGSRSYQDGTLQAGWAQLWANSGTTIYADVIQWIWSYAAVGENYRAQGYSVRCIQD